MRTRTKIICTIGPSVHDAKSMEQLIRNGMDIARVNLSHGMHSEHQETIRNLKEAREKSKKCVGILIDTRGPEIRTIVRPSGISVFPKKRVSLGKVKEGDEEHIAIRPDIVLEYLEVGTTILIDNGYIQAKVVEKTASEIIVEFLNGGTVFSSKSVNIPGIHMPFPAMTPKDIADIEFACEEGADLIAASFIRSAENILEIKRLLTQYKRPDIQVLAKIENTEGVENFDSILHVADGIMVARGDLGVEVPISQVPALQKMMIKKCNFIGKPVVTATQMLESMISNPRPTRAEVSDVANAIYDGTSAVMLSGETAVGAYPIETVRTMQSIVQETETHFEYESFFDMHTKRTYHDVPSALTLSAVKTAYSLDAQAIFTFTHSGATARLLSRLKPKMPIIAFTTDVCTYYQLSLSWGVFPVRCELSCSTVDEAFTYASQWGLDSGVVSYGDLVVLTAGSPFWVPGTSNTILVDSIGDVLVRGERGVGDKVHGPVLLMPGEIFKSHSAQGAILVLSSFNEKLVPFVEESLGVILQGLSDDRESEELLLTICRGHGISAVIGVDGAFRVLRDKQVVTIDSEKAIVYKGVVR